MKFSLLKNITKTLLFILFSLIIETQAAVNQYVQQVQFVNLSNYYVFIDLTDNQGMLIDRNPTSKKSISPKRGLSTISIQQSGKYFTNAKLALSNNSKTRSPLSTTINLKNGSTARFSNGVTATVIKAKLGTKSSNIPGVSDYIVTIK